MVPAQPHASNRVVTAAATAAPVAAIGAADGRLLLSALADFASLFRDNDWQMAEERHRGTQGPSNQYLPGTQAAKTLNPKP